MNKKTCRRILCAAFVSVAGFNGGVMIADHYLHKKIAPPVCAKDSNKILFAQKLPQVNSDFNKMSHLPLTGRPVYQALASPVSQIRTCVTDPRELGSGTLGLYYPSYNRLYVGNNATMATFTHENFHAGQDLHGVNLDTPQHLTLRDYIAASLLREATAEAYAFTLYQEDKRSAQPKNIGYQKNLHDIHMEKIFDEAYDAAWKKYADTGDKTRKAKSLEAGGKALTLALLNGKSAFWSKSYALLSKENADIVFKKGVPLNKKIAGYDDLRSNLFWKCGFVSPEINLTPDVLLGSRADAKTRQLGYKVAALIKKDASRPSAGA
jgi:hypothetical protein